MASPALTPSLALRYLGELSTDVRAAVLVDPDGALAASEPDDGALGEPLRELVDELLESADRAVTGGVGEVEVATPAGTVFVVRRGGYTLAVAASRFALSSLMRYDLHRILADLQGTSP